MLRFETRDELEVDSLFANNQASEITMGRTYTPCHSIADLEVIEGRCLETRRQRQLIQ